MRIRWAMSWVAGTVVVTLIACGIDIPDVIPIDGGGSDATFFDVSRADVISNDAAKDAGGPDVIMPPTCDAGCGFTLPQGFGLVTFSAGTTPTCDPGQTPSDVVYDPQVGPGACTCACSVSAPPDCSNGNVKIRYDSNYSATCSTFGAPVPVSGPGCVIASSTLNTDLLLIAPFAKDAGACTMNGAVDNTKLQASAARVCTPSSCETTTCSPPVGKRLCAIATGDVACPAPFTQKRLIGASAAIVCSPCGACSIINVQCAGTLSLFSDSMCSSLQLLGAFTTDAGCQPTGGTNTEPIGSYKWTGFGTSSCTPDASAAPSTATLNGMQTVCCRPGF